MAQTSSIHDHFDLYLTSMTSIFNLHENFFQTALLLLHDNNCAKLFWNPCIMYKLWPDKLKIWPFWPLLDPCDLDLQPTWKLFQMALLLLKHNNCEKLFWNPCINVQVMARSSSIYDHFDLYLTPVTLTFNLPGKNVSNGTSPSRGQQLCKIILKSMHKCTSYAPDKLNTCIWPFWPLFDPLPWPSTYLKKMFQMPLLLLKGKNCAKLFWNPWIIVQVMVWTNPDGSTDALTNGRTHIHRTKIVTTMSHLPASGLDKNAIRGDGKFPPLPPLEALLWSNAAWAFFLKAQCTPNTHITRTVRKSDYTPALVLPKHMADNFDEKCRKKEKYREQQNGECPFSIPRYYPLLWTSIPNLKFLS